MIALEDPPVLDGLSTGESGTETATVAERVDPCNCGLTHDSIDGRCPNDLPVGHSPKRKYCDDCPKGMHKRSKADTPPVNVTVKFPGGAAKDFTPTQRKVAEAATAWLGMLAVLLEVQGDATCATATKRATPEVANQLAILSKFHPIIAKVLAPIEATGEALAWISLALAISPVVLTVLTHHKVISEEAAARIGIVTAMGAVVGNAPAPAEAA